MLRECDVSPSACMHLSFAFDGGGAHIMRRLSTVPLGVREGPGDQRNLQRKRCLQLRDGGVGGTIQKNTLG